MHIYISGDLEATLIIHTYVDHETEREKIRTGLVSLLKHSFCKDKDNVKMRFADECEVCGKRKKDWKSGSTCANPACEKGFPPNLAYWLEKCPYEKDETASAYLDRLTRLWKDSQ